MQGAARASSQSPTRRAGLAKPRPPSILATALAASGETTLLIDLDPQGNASTGVGLAWAARTEGSYGLLTGSSAFDVAAQPTIVPNLWLVPAEAGLAGAEVELVELARREFRLQSALAAVRSGPSPFSYVLVDCPPSLGLLTLNALVAADAVLVPLQCEFFALEGLTHLVRTIESGPPQPQPASRIAGDRADHVRPPQQFVRVGRGRCAGLLRQAGV